MHTAVPAAPANRSRVVPSFGSCSASSCCRSPSRRSHRWRQAFESTESPTKSQVSQKHHHNTPPRPTRSTHYYTKTNCTPAHDTQHTHVDGDKIYTAGRYAVGFLYRFISYPTTLQEIEFSQTSEDSRTLGVQTRGGQMVRTPHARRDDRREAGRQGGREAGRQGGREAHARRTQAGKRRG